MHSNARALLTLGICLLLVACGDSTTSFGDPPDDNGGGQAGQGGEGRQGGEAGQGGTGGDPDPDPPPLPPAPQLDVQWTPCPWDTGGQALDAECAAVDVPVDWWDPDGATIELFVKRGGSLGVPNAQQVWFLMGGPGGASAGYEGLGRQMFEAVPPLHVYLLDHRGVGRSTRLGCSAENDASEDGYSITMDEWPGCIDEVVATWGADLDHFSTTQAAIDLGVLIDQTRIGNQMVHIHGGSYGTYWAQRYMQIFPNDATAVSMLGVVNPTIFSFTRYDQQYETVGGAYLDACAADAFCVTKLGADPETKLREIYDDIDGKCPAAAAAGLDRETLQTYAGGFLLWGWDQRVFPLALAYRIDRCAPEDVTAIQTFLANVPSPIDGLLNDRLFSRVLGTHIGQSEMWSAPIPSVADADALAEQGLFAFGGVGRRVELDAIWPKYNDVFYDDAWATASIPILMINGELDPASTHAEALGVGAHFTGPQQFFVEIPDGSHSWSSPTTGGFTCATNVFANFVVDPTQPLLDCMGTVVPIGFQGSFAMASLMGTVDIWENVSTMITAPDPEMQASTNEGLRRAFAQLSQRVTR